MRDRFRAGGRVARGRHDHERLADLRGGAAGCHPDGQLHLRRLSGVPRHLQGRQLALPDRLPRLAGGAGDDRLDDRGAGRNRVADGIAVGPADPADGPSHRRDRSLRRAAGHRGAVSGRPPRAAGEGGAGRSLRRSGQPEASIVELRFFGGLTIHETAEHLGIAPATVVRHWDRARAWLFRQLSRGEAASADSSSL
ncbi:MAG: hypothetical protein GY719_24725 [bacterium]|nr:hypothetical protein [bacterium]